jgi:hypothetical protein
VMFPKPGRRSSRKRGDGDQAVYRHVEARDGGCVASRVDPAVDRCEGRIEREHVRPGGGAMGMRRITRPGAVVLLCRHHHQDGWATSHKPALREYLARVEPEG